MDEKFLMSERVKDIFVKGNEYIAAENSGQYQDIFRKEYDRLKPDTYAKGEIRKRAYQRYTYSVEKGLSPADSSDYFQTYDSNNVDGGVDRKFGPMPENLLSNDLFNDILAKDVNYIVTSFPHLRKMNIGVHPIRYCAKFNAPSYSSPLWLHKDDEELVFLHFLSKSDNAVGGDSIISENGKSIEGVLNLSNFMDTLILTRDFLHAVTPLGCKNEDELSYRDILLVTLESKVQEK